MADENTNTSYTSRDFETIKKELIDLVPEHTDKWTDFRESDLGIVLVELMSTLGDMMFYAMDRQALETYIDTAQEKRNVRAILKNVGYKMRTYNSAETTLKFATLHTEDVNIPRFTSVTSGEDVDGEVIEYVTKSNVLLPAESSVEIDAIQGTLEEYTFGYSDIENDKRIMLPDKDVAEGTIEVYINDIKWTEVDDTLLHSDSGKYFSMEFDKEDNVYVQLYPGWENLVRRPEDATIDILYLRSLGEDGMIGKNKLVNLDSTLYDIDGQDVSDTIEVYNIERSMGGENPQTVEEAKAIAPQVVKTMWTAVTIEDYETLCRNYTGISNVLALDWSIIEGKDSCQATTSIGSGDNGTVELEIDRYGEDGNNYTVEVIDTSGTADVELHAYLENDYNLKIELATDGSGNLDSTKNTASLVADEINLEVGEDIIATATGDGSGALDTAETADFNGGIGPSFPYIIHLHLVPNDGGQPSDLLKESLQDYLHDRKVATTQIIIKETSYYSIDIDADIYTVDDAVQSNVTDAINSALEEYFAYENREFSEVLNYADMIRIIEDSHEDIIRAELNNPATNVDVPYSQLPILNSVTLNYS